MHYPAIFFMLLLWLLDAVADEVQPGVLQTPGARFQGLKGFPFAPRYMTIQGLRVHYLDGAPVTGILFCCYNASPPGAICSAS